MWFARKAHAEHSFPMMSGSLLPDCFSPDAYGCAKRHYDAFTRFIIGYFPIHCIMCRFSVLEWISSSPLYYIGLQFLERHGRLRRGLRYVDQVSICVNMRVRATR